MSTTAPDGFSIPDASWLSITRPDGRTQLAAVFRPRSGGGVHPVIVALHGSSGLPKPLLDWAPQLAAAGYVVVVGCYLDAYAPVAQARPGVFMPCPGLPDSSRATPGDLASTSTTLLDAAADLPGVKRGAIGLLGISLGAMVALSGDDPRVKAIVADSGYRTAPGTTHPPVLLLGMTTDPNVDHALVVGFEQAQRAAGATIDAHYYPGTGHVTIFGAPAVSDDAARRIEVFLQKHL